MNILCVNYEYPPIGGGGGVVCKGLAETLVQMGHRVDVVTSGVSFLPAFEEINGVRIFRVKCIRRYKHYVTTPEMLTLIYPLYKKALELIRKNNYDLNHTHFVVPSGIVSYMLWKKTGLPYLITAHGSDIPGYNPDRFILIHWLIRLPWRKIVKNSVLITTPSYFLRRLIHSYIDIPVEVVPNGHKFESYIERLKVNRILVVTRMFERKGIQFLLKALREINADWEIDILGDGPYLPKLRSLAHDMPEIHFRGYVQGKELHDYYASSNIYVFPSVRENFPVVLLEAMHFGCAVITTDAHGCAEVIGNAGIKTQCGNKDDLRNALVYLMKNKDEIERLGKLGQERAKRFVWKKIAHEYLKLFEQYRR